VRLSKQEQVQQRRTKVLELSSQGLTQQEIADRL
jgi:transcriptional regulator